MQGPPPARFTKRYKTVTKEKAEGATYTPRILADFVASQIVQTARNIPTGRSVRLLDPAIGDGELLLSLLQHLHHRSSLKIDVYGFETNKEALNIATCRIKQQYPAVALYFEVGNFLDFVLEHLERTSNDTLSHSAMPEAYDLIIANPPYVRTQTMGASQAQILAEQFSLSGRVDLYHAFILGIAQVLSPQGMAGIIVSNRFMTTKSGAAVRAALLERFDSHHIWDLGDTKLFAAAVLPAVLLAGGKNGDQEDTPCFTSIYSTIEPAQDSAANPIDALSKTGIVQINDGRCFQVQHGTLNTNGTPDGVWRISTQAVENWLETVEAHTWGTFGDIGKVRVGVKTCADKVFIRSDWQEIHGAEIPELLKPVTTHHIGRRYNPLTPEHAKQILYPHEVVQGSRQPVELCKFPRSKAYLERHRPALEGRKYVLEAGREWYEIWVPQDPEGWGQTKLVFRDIAEEPTFWIDQEGSIVNGDCYWLVCQNPIETDLLWLAVAIGNSTFIERFYDYRFHNKLYAGRRRFITQYVEKFPLPDPQSLQGKAIICQAKKAYESVSSPESAQLQRELNHMVWNAFGLAVEEVIG